jgi:ferredoxin-NADP reductase
MILSSSRLALSSHCCPFKTRFSTMASKTVKQSLSHLERTAAEPRDDVNFTSISFQLSQLNKLQTLHRVTLTRIDPVNRTIRLFQLTPIVEPGRKPITVHHFQPWAQTLFTHLPDNWQFLPGQWLDVHVPGIHKAGGFTITSPPSLLQPPTNYLELAIQKSSLNPPAAWLWQKPESILGSELLVRVGGSFVWPPPLKESEIRRVVFVAGGVGINPLMSIVSALAAQTKEKGKLGFHVKFLYTTRDFKPDASPSEILFLERLVSVFDTLGDEGQFELFLTSGQQNGDEIESRTISKSAREQFVIFAGCLRWQMNLLKRRGMLRELTRGTYFLRNGGKE